MADLVALPPTVWDKKPWDTCLAPLTDELWQRFNWFRDLCRERLNVEQYVFSGNRTYAEQVYLRQQNCGTSQFDVYQKSPSLCHPETARPGTSKHEGGKAIDCGIGYNDVRGPIRAIAAECGLGYTVQGEDWHIEVVSHPEIPPEYTNPQPVPPEEDDMPANPVVAIKKVRPGQPSEYAIFYPGTPFRVALKSSADVEQAVTKPPLGLGLTYVGELDPWFFRNTEPVDNHESVPS